jgi:hypothetical protein
VRRAAPTARLVAALSLAAAGVTLPAAAQTQSHHHVRPAEDSAAVAVAADAFVAAAREATQRYHDRAAAIAEGFRPLGPDFPAMGEHWVHPGRMVEGRLDVTRPQALSYAVIDGRPVLTGVIYARPLRPGEPLPDFPEPGYPWHDHAGAIDEESVLLHHIPTDGDGAGRVRLTMLHAWVWTDNPEGVFRADNWALPFLRLHLDVPTRIEADAARMLSLLTGGDGYYRTLLGALARPTTDEAASATQRIAAARADLASWLPTTLRGRVVPAEALDVLSARWRELWVDIAAELRPEAAARLAPLIIPE